MFATRLQTAARALTNDRRWLKEWAVPAAFILITTVYVALFHYRAPYYDQWQAVRMVMNWDKRALRLVDLFYVAEGHWHASANIVLLALSKLTKMNHLYESLASLGFALLGFGAIVVMMARAAKDFAVEQARPFLFAAAAAIWFSLNQADNWVWGWQVAVFINTAGAAWCVALLTADRLSWLHCALAAVCAFLAVTSFATGWAILPVGAALILARVNGKRSAGVYLKAGAWILFCAALVALFLHMRSLDSLLAGENLSQPLAGLGQTPLHLIYTANFVASPMSRFTDHLQWPALALAAGLVIWATPRDRRDPRRFFAQRSLRAFAGLAAYAVGAGLLTSLGRSAAYGADHAFVGRYVNFGNFFWLAVLALAILALIRRRRDGARLRMPAVMIGLLFVLNLGTVLHGAGKTMERARRLNPTTAALVAARPGIDEQALDAWKAPHQHIAEEVRYLEEHNLSFYRRAALR